MSKFVTETTSFASQLAKFAELTNERVEDVIKATSFDIFGQVIERTPVDTGRARNNWQASINSPASGEVEGGDEKGTQAIQLMTPIIASAKGDDSIYLTNNLPYIQRLEEGHSQEQAPNGMVRLTVLEFERAVKKQVRKLSR